MARDTGFGVSFLLEHNKLRDLEAQSIQPIQQQQQLSSRCLCRIVLSLKRRGLLNLLIGQHIEGCLQCLALDCTEDCSLLSCIRWWPMPLWPIVGGLCNTPKSSNVVHWNEAPGTQQKVWRLQWAHLNHNARKCNMVQFGLIIHQRGRYFIHFCKSIRNMIPLTSCR